jgi:hypothetical protein
MAAAIRQDETLLDEVMEATKEEHIALSEASKTTTRDWSDLVATSDARRRCMRAEIEWWRSRQNSQSRDSLLGAYVIATNEAGGRWRGRVITYTLDGKAIVRCDAINIGDGLGWIELNGEEREFDPERLEACGREGG